MYSAYTALATSGARIDPTYFSTCASSANSSALAASIRELTFTADKVAPVLDNYSGPLGPAQKGESLLPITDKRIRAVAAMHPLLLPLFGERGPQFATVPTLIMSQLPDNYTGEIALYYGHLGANPKDRYLIGIKDVDLANYYSEHGLALYKYFLTAFFDSYLKGSKSNAQYLEATYVSSHPSLQMGLN